jgi:four helix bundle protein
MPVKKKYVGNVRDLIVYRKALTFRKNIYALVRTLPPSEQNIIGNNLMKGCCAVVANLAEGNVNFYYRREYEHFDIALCKITKCRALLDLLFLLQGSINKESYDRINNNAKEIVRLIITLMKRIERCLTNETEPIANYRPIQTHNPTNLESVIYEKALLFMESIKKMVGKLPLVEIDNVFDQIVRASSSVYENLVKSKDTISAQRFADLNISLGSIAEVESFLDISVMENYISKMEYQSLSEEAGDIQSMLIEMMNRIDKAVINN